MSKGNLILVQGLEIFTRTFPPDGGLEGLLLVSRQPLHALFSCAASGVFTTARQESCRWTDEVWQPASGDDPGTRWRV